MFKIYDYILLVSVAFLFVSCVDSEKKTEKPVFKYEHFRDSVKAENHQLTPESNNIFDSGAFIPSEDTPKKLLVDIDTLFSRLKKLEQLPATEKAAINENIRMLDSFYKSKDRAISEECREQQCGIYAEIHKVKQLMFLYIDGELKDSFLVSTGKKNYSTPEMSKHPSGPIFTKYTSRKFPGGNYKGLGNMPYAVFVKGGYAIHGTTPGNFSKLGQVASHGCIRLHPDNARVFYELVKLYGLSNTWVKVTN